jgi:toxin-antitoxin system PIN domain toxin
MPGTLFDTNIWLAVVFASHPGHVVARQALQAASSTQPALFCRATEQSFLRLLTTPALLKAYGADGLGNRDALQALKALQGLPQVRFSDEPPGTVVRWHALATRDTASPKLWMDAYLAGFALAGGLRLVTLDADFRQFVAQGLDATVLTIT